MTGEQLFRNKPQLGARLNHSHKFSKGLVLDLHMNDGAGIRCFDFSPYQNHGTMLNFGVPANSRSIQGIKFDGVDDYIDCGNKNSLNILNSITIETWIYPVSLNDYDAIIMKTTSTNYDDGYGVFVASDKITFFINSWNLHVAQSTFTFSTSLNKWFHVVGVYDQKNIRIFVNCVEGTSSAYTLAIITTAGTLEVGRGKDNLYDFDGFIGNSRIWNRALSAQDIKELYTNPYPEEMYI